MKTIIKKSLQSLLLVPALALGVGLLAPVGLYAQPTSDNPLGDGIGATGQKDESRTANAIVEDVVNWFLFIVGAIAVIMLIYGGFKYITSGGDASNVTAAKNTILYAVIGLIVVVLAGAIVNFAIDFATA